MSTPSGLGLSPKMDIVIPGGIQEEDSIRTMADGLHTWWQPCGFGVINLYEIPVRKGALPIVAYVHNDVIIKEQGWDQRVEDAFEDTEVGVVGFGGALCHGSPDLYKTPYKLQQLGRSYYFSNVDDAEEHGARFTGTKEVAVLDGFALIVRRELLEKMGGWQPEKWPPHHVYDYRVCCEAHRHGYKVMLVGVRCHHLGGRTATTDTYQEWAKGTKWGSDVEMHKAGHRMLYDEYKDVLPWVTREGIIAWSLEKEKV
jgi:hypothetical protein